MAYTPRTNLPTLEADLWDGSDVVTLVFLGRRSIAGIDRIMMTTSNPSVAKVRRAMQLRKKHPNFIQAVDEEQNARITSLVNRDGFWMA